MIAQYVRKFAALPASVRYLDEVMERARLALQFKGENEIAIGIVARLCGGLNWPVRYHNVIEYPKHFRIVATRAEEVELIRVRGAAQLAAFDTL